MVEILNIFESKKILFIAACFVTNSTFRNGLSPTEIMHMENKR